MDAVVCIAFVIIHLLPDFERYRRSILCIDDINGCDDAFDENKDCGLISGKII